MKRTIKYAAVASVAGALAIGMAAPGHAAHGRNTAAAVGFGAGAMVGVAAANAAHPAPYGPAYAYADQRDSAPGYGAYAYAPASNNPNGGCATKGSYGQGADFSACGQ